MTSIVTRFGEILQFWKIFKNLWQFLYGFLGIWQSFWTHFGSILHFWTNFKLMHMAKYWNTQSGHTGWQMRQKQVCMIAKTNMLEQQQHPIHSARLINFRLRRFAKKLLNYSILRDLENSRGSTTTTTKHLSYNIFQKIHFVNKKTVGGQFCEDVLWKRAVWPDWAIYWTLGNN